MTKISTNEHLARILGNTRRKKRMISIPKIAESIEYMAQELGGVGPLSEQVTLSDTMLRQFLSVKELHPKVREMFDNRTLDSVDLCSQLATLQSSDQIVLAESVASGALQTKDVRDYRELRRFNADLSAEEIIEKVVSAKPKVEFVAQFVLRSGDTLKKLGERFTNYLDPDDILRLEADGSIVSLALSKNGRDCLRDLGHSAGFNIEQAVQMVASGKL